MFGNIIVFKECNLRACFIAIRDVVEGCFIMSIIHQGQLFLQANKYLNVQSEKYKTDKYIFWEQIWIFLLDINKPTKSYKVTVTEVLYSVHWIIKNRFNN